MSDEKYLAHRNSETLEEQPLEEHLENTGMLAGKFAEAFGAYQWGYCAGKIHDIGKYSEAFQRRIRGSEEKVDHAAAGAQLLWKKKGFYLFVSYCIAGHHSGLPDTGGTGDGSDQSTMIGRMKKRVQDYSEFQKEVSVPEITVPPFQPVKGENPGFFRSMLIRMLYSCLVDADFLDTENFMNGGDSVQRRQGEGLEILFRKLLKKIEGWLGNCDTDTINGRRTEILKNCLEKGLEDKGLFRLTVPTGGGKTIASLAFALQHAVAHHMKRIIYVVPYTSIIEQNAKVFADILGKENVLENHCNVDYDSSDEFKEMQLAAENWDKPVIVTTNVQFFESLFSNKSSRCRKLHNIVDSVIIFDEAQMLPVDYLKPCIAAMEQLVRYYRSTLVLCTATQPALETLFSEDVKVQELCPRMEEQFAFFKRTQIKDMGQLSLEKLIEKIEGEQQALCIFNTRKMTQKVYRHLNGDGVYHLSTTMYPAHRKKRLEEIRCRLRNHERCIVISTSLVEAGVDLDFQTVYRQVAGADSIIQASGRCNREGIRPLSECCTYIFRLNEKEYMPGQRQQMAVTEALMFDGKNLEKQEVIHEYFSDLYHLRGESLDKKNIMGKFRGTSFSFEEAAKEFKLIEQNTRTIFIPRTEEATELVRRVRESGITRQLMREAGQFCVNVYEDDFQNMWDADLLESAPLFQDTKDYFVLRKTDWYHDDIGLEMNVECGQAIIF